MIVVKIHRIKLALFYGFAIVTKSHENSKNEHTVVHLSMLSDLLLSAPNTLVPTEDVNL